MAEYDRENARRYKVRATGVKAPSSNWSDIECPFCGQQVRAYWWSLAGSGKKCLCGAMHDSMGYTAQRKGKVNG